MKILLAKRRALGDTVLLSSTVDLMARSVPGAEISVLVPKAFAPVLENHPRIKKIYTFESGWFSLTRILRAERFDHFFQLHASPNSSWQAWLVGAKFSHFHVQNKDSEKPYGKHPNALEWDAFHIRTVFGDKVEMPAPVPQIYLSDREKAEGKEFWAKRGLDFKRLVFFGLGASRSTKRWLPSHFARLAELLHDRKDAVPAIVVGPGEEEESFSGRVINELRARGLKADLGDGKGGFVHLAGISVRELAKALSAVRGYVGSDSGPKHMAAAVGIPTLTIFGPEDPVEWHPYDRERHRVFFLENLPCRHEDNGRWCGIPLCNETTKEKHRCMRDIEPLDVYESVERFFSA